MMGYKTKEGALFTDWYGQQSCIAWRACFITGQVGFRTGLLKVGLPGAKEGLQARDVTIAELLKPAHGFDEFYGSLYHLNAEEEPENPDANHRESPGGLHSYKVTEGLKIRK